MSSPEDSHEYRLRVARDIAEMVCRPCSDPRRHQYVLDFENPLECKCRCRTIEMLLRRVLPSDL